LKETFNQMFAPMLVLRMDTARDVYLIRVTCLMHSVCSTKNYETTCLVGFVDRNI